MPENITCANVDWWEHRGERSYDEQDASGILHPNGTKIASFDRPFLAAAMREILRHLESR